MKLFSLMDLLIPGLAVALVSLACQPTDVGGTADKPFILRADQAYWVETGDGRKVYCIHMHHGPSCDWENAKAHPTFPVVGEEP